jgi:predicted transcriptional regulator
MELKVMLMSTVEIRSELHQLIDQVDERFLKAVYLMVSAYQQEDPIAGYDLQGNPKLASEMMDKYEAGIAAVEEGNFITADELEEKSQQWLSRTK